MEHFSELPAAEPNPKLFSPRRESMKRAIVLPSIALVLGLTAMQAKSLWHEWHSLRIAQYDDVHSRALGYHDIMPDFNYATPPDNWVRDDGDHSYLWGGWDRHAKKHLWFTFAKGGIDARHLSHPLGRDSLRAIDHPRIENKGGEIWEMIPPDHVVLVSEIAGRSIAYPMDILDKVIAINDTVNDRHLLIVYTPFKHENSSVALYDARLNGKTRLTMGHSGYLWDKRPLLYDREGESLWVSQSQGLVAVAGTRKGTVLKRLAQMNPAHWGEWSAAHPDGRLVVGANRVKKVVEN